MHGGDERFGTPVWRGMPSAPGMNHDIREEDRHASREASLPTFPDSPSDTPWCSLKTDVFGTKWISAGKKLPEGGAVLSHTELRTALSNKIQADLGLRWHFVGNSRPKHGKELKSVLLSEALMQNTVFKRHEWEQFAIYAEDLSINQFIKAGNSYFQPAVEFRQAEWIDLKIKDLRVGLFVQLGEIFLKPVKVDVVALDRVPFTKANSDLDEIAKKPGDKVETVAASKFSLAKDRVRKQRKRERQKRMETEAQLSSDDEEESGQGLGKALKEYMKEPGELAKILVKVQRPPTDNELHRWTSHAEQLQKEFKVAADIDTVFELPEGEDMPELHSPPKAGIRKQGLLQALAGSNVKHSQGEIDGLMSRMDIDADGLIDLDDFRFFVKRNLEELLQNLPVPPKERSHIVAKAFHSKAGAERDANRKDLQEKGCSDQYFQQVDFFVDLERLWQTLPIVPKEVSKIAPKGFHSAAGEEREAALKYLREKGSKDKNFQDINFYQDTDQVESDKAGIDLEPWVLANDIEIETKAKNEKLMKARDKTVSEALEAIERGGDALDLRFIVLVLRVLVGVCARMRLEDEN